MKTTTIITITETDDNQSNDDEARNLFETKAHEKVIQQMAFIFNKLVPEFSENLTDALVDALSEDCVNATETLAFIEKDLQAKNHRILPIKNKNELELLEGALTMQKEMNMDDMKDDELCAANYHAAKNLLERLPK